MIPARTLFYTSITSSITSAPPATSWDSTIDTSDVLYTNNDLTIDRQGAGARGVVYSLIGQTTGAFVYEITVDALASQDIGVVNQSYRDNASFQNVDIGTGIGGIGFRNQSGANLDGSFESTWGVVYTVGDIVTVKVDLAADTITIVVNNNDDTDTRSISTLGSGKIYVGMNILNTSDTATAEFNPTNMTWASTLFPGIAGMVAN